MSWVKTPRCPTCSDVGPASIGTVNARCVLDPAITASDCVYACSLARAAAIHLRCRDGRGDTASLTRESP